MSSVGVPEEIYNLLVVKQVEITSKRRIPISMTQLMKEIIEIGLPLIEEDINKMLINKKDELQEKYNIEISELDIVENILRHSIPIYDIINNMKDEDKCERQEKKVLS